MTNTTLTPDQARALVKAKGTKFATVRFIKKDGSERRINGLFRAAKHILGTGRATPDHLIAIWSPKEGWRSFDVTRVVEVR
jgi:hypothetical protein